MLLKSQKRRVPNNIIQLKNLKIEKRKIMLITPKSKNTSLILTMRVITKI